MIILLLLAFCLFVFACYQVIKALFKFCQAIFYKKFANEKQIDEGFKKYVIKESDSYKEFESKFDENIESLINSKKISF